MSSTAQLLQYAAGAGAVYCALAYIYAFVWKSKGDRRFHVASLMFTGIALASLAALTPSIIGGASLFAMGSGIICLIASVGCQSFAAFRGRKGDRRAARKSAAEPGVRLVSDTAAKAA